MLRATLVYGFVALFVVAAGPPGLLWTMASGSNAVLFRLAFACIGMAGWLSGVRLVVRGKDHLRAGQPYLFLSNHQGNFDGPILFYTTRRDCRAVIKKEMMRIPLLGLVFRLADFVPVDRGDPIQAHAGIDQATRLMKEGLSLFAFPEGTRSRDGRLGPFKKGVFIIALKAGIPVVPVSIRNSRLIQPPGRYGIRAGTVEVIFHPPIATAGMTLEDRDRLLQSTRQIIAAGLKTVPAAEPSSISGL